MYCIDEISDNNCIVIDKFVQNIENTNVHKKVINEYFGSDDI